jgi:hypothetical protein
MRLNQRDQAFPRHHLIHLNQEALATDLFMLVSVLSVSEGNLFLRETRKTGWIYLTRINKSFSEFP